MPFDLDDTAACSSCGKPTIDTGVLIEHHGKDVCWECLLKLTRMELRLFVSGNELLTDEAYIDWVIKGLIESNSIGQLFGPSGGGKSFTALDLVLCVATGQPWNGRETKQGAVLYLAGEGRTGMKRRIKGWHQHHGKPDLSAFHLSQHTVPFDEVATGKIVQAGKDVENATGRDVRFVVVDTLSRHMVGDENSTKEMASFVATCEDIRSQFPGSVLLLVHHTGNSEEAKHRSRGSSALKAAMDFELHCDKGLLTFTKLKDGLLPDPVEFKLSPVQIGTDLDGEPIVTCIVGYGERSQRHQIAELTPNERMLFELCRSYPDILVGDLRNTFYEKRRECEPDAKTNTLKNAFLRSYQGLLDKAMISEKNNVVNIQKTTPSHVTTPSQNNNMTGGRHTVTKRHTPTGWCDVCDVTVVSDDPLAALDEFITPEVSP